MRQLAILIAALLLSVTTTIFGRQPQSPGPANPSPVYIIRAGRLIDPENGSAATDQTIVVQNGRITAIGRNPAVPPQAETIDLSQLSVLPGLVDAHTHLAMSMKRGVDNSLLLTYIQQPTALRAIQAVSNGIQMLSAGFTVVRDMGNNGLYADTALRIAIEQGWVPGPTVVNAGIIIGGLGG